MSRDTETPEQRRERIKKQLGIGRGTNPEARKSALERLKLKRTKDKSRVNSGGRIIHEKQIAETTEEIRSTTSNLPHLVSQHNHGDRFVVGDKRKFISKQNAEDAKHRKFNFDSTVENINNVHVGEDKNHKVSKPTTALKLERLKALKKQKDATLKAAAREGSRGLSLHDNISNVSNNLDTTKNNYNGICSLSREIDLGWPSDSDSDSSDSILLSDIVQPMSQIGPEKISPILHARGSAHADLHNVNRSKTTVRISPILSSGGSPNNVRLPGSSFESPVSDGSCSVSPKQCCNNRFSTLSPNKSISKKSPCSICMKSPSSKRLLFSPPQASHGNIEKSPTFNRSSLSKDKEETRRHVIDFLKEKFHSGTSGHSSYVPSNESLNRNVFKMKASNEGSGRDRKRAIAKKSSTIRVDRKQDLDQSDCQIIGSSTLSKEDAAGRSSFHSKVLGLPRPTKKG